MQHGFDYTYTGSPYLNRVGKVIVDPEFLGLNKDKDIVALIPSVENSEFAKLFSYIVDVTKAITKKLPNVEFVVPLPEGVTLDDLYDLYLAKGHKDVASSFSQSDDVTGFFVGGLHLVKGMSLEVLALSKAALTTSGSASIESLLLGVPFATLDVNKNIDQSYSNMANWAMGDEVVPAFDFEDSIDDVVETIVSLVGDEKARESQLEKFSDFREHLKGSAARNTAEVLSDYFNTRKRSSRRLR